MKIGQMEKDCVEKSVRCSLQITKEDLEARVKLDLAAKECGEPNYVLEPCKSVEILAHVFNRKKVYYKSNRQWSNTPVGLPEVRSHMITVFRRNRGFKALIQYLELRAGDNTPGLFPTMDLCKDLLEAIYETLPSGSSPSSSKDNNNGNNNGGNRGEEEMDPQSSKFINIQNEARALAEVIMKHILLLDEITLKKLDTEIIKKIRFQLSKLFGRLSDAEGSGGAVNSTSSFFNFWRALAHKLITSSSLPVKLSGWDNIVEIIKESASLAPPPKAFLVKGGGTSFINGRYKFDPKRILDNGYARPNAELQYNLTIPDWDPEGKPADGAGKTLTLFRCTMRSQHKWWFLSEADPDQPGTDKDVDYYQHKSKREEEGLPSSSGWLTCRAGADPSPTLEPLGKLVPRGEERNTLEHQLAKWAIENEVIELVLGDGIHREVVSRSVKLIQFLAGMCDRDNNDEVDGEEMNDGSDEERNKYCLQASHLLLAWKTCTNKADAAVSAQVYQLLVKILPSLSPSLAIPLIEAIRDSLEAKPTTPQGSIKGSLHHHSSHHHQGGIPASSSGNLSALGEGGRSDFFEVSEFCCAIAEKMLEDNASSSNTANNNQAATTGNTDSPESTGVNKVRESILSLQWAVLSHPSAQSLKSYESIKQYVTIEIRKQDNTTGVLRMKFLLACRDEIAKYANIAGPSSSTASLGSTVQVVDETHALHMVQLSKFLLEGFTDRDDLDLLVAYNPAEPKVHLPTLIFHDLVSYMKRRGTRSNSAMLPVTRKVRALFLLYLCALLCYFTHHPYMFHHSCSHHRRVLRLNSTIHEPYLHAFKFSATSMV